MLLRCRSTRTERRCRPALAVTLEPGASKSSVTAVPSGPTTMAFTSCAGAGGQISRLAHNNVCESVCARARACMCMFVCATPQ